MKNVLDQATVKFDFKWKESLLAKVTLNWENVFEVRFFRLSLRTDGTIWFQPPALKEFRYAKCFAVLNNDEWTSFSNRIIALFLEETEKEKNKGMIPPHILEKLSPENQINIDEIP